MKPVGAVVQSGVVLVLITVFTGILAMRSHALLGLAASYGLTAAARPHNPSHDLRINHIQVVGTHNSYHREISYAERTIFEKYIPAPINFYYSHSKWTDQLSHQLVRSFEIDLHSDLHGGLYAHPLIWTLSNLTNSTIPYHDPAMLLPGLKVFHITDVDTNAICHTFTECLTQLKTWSDAHPAHLPLTFDLELKSDAFACGLGGVCSPEASTWNLTQILEIDREILATLGRDRVITPDDVRKPNLTLEQSVLQHGWPSLASSRGKFMFYFDNEPDSTPDIRGIYTADGHASLENRTVFTNALEGSPDAAFLKRNDPLSDPSEIHRLVSAGYFVRTRADDSLSTVLSKNSSMRTAAFASGAHVVSTDFPWYGMSARWDWDYAVTIGGGKVARCNPIAAPGWCRDGMLQEGWGKGEREL